MAAYFQKFIVKHKQDLLNFQFQQFKNVFKIPLFTDKFDFYSLKSYLINDGKFFKEETL